MLVKEEVHGCGFRKEQGLNKLLLLLIKIESQVKLFKCPEL